MVSSFRNYSQKIQGPLIGLTSLIKQKGLTKGLTDLLYDLGFTASYKTFSRYENSILPDHKSKLFDKVIDGRPLWFDNFTRLVAHSNVFQGIFSFSFLLNMLGSYHSIQLTSVGILNSPGLGKLWWSMVTHYSFLDLQSQGAAPLTRPLKPDNFSSPTINLQKFENLVPYIMKQQKNLFHPNWVYVLVLALFIDF